MTGEDALRRTTLQQHLRGAAVITGLWTLVGLLFAGRNLMVARLAPDHPVSLADFVATMTGWWIWVFLTPIVLFLARRFPLERRRWRRSLPGLAAGFCVVVVLDVLLAHIVWSMLELPYARGGLTPEYLARVFVPTFTLDLFIYAAIVAAVHARDSQREVRERERRAALLEVQLVQAQLRALKMQLHPHFLFNTLHAIHALMEEDVRKASRMLTLLSELLRAALDDPDAQAVPLRQELAFVERYLEIHRIRFGDRLEVALDVDPDVLDALVPHLMLQPLVENALVHGAAPNGRRSRVTVRAWRRGDALSVAVMDNGPGMAAIPPKRGRTGIGLTNTEQRLRKIYGDAYQMRHDEAPGGGLALTLTLPFYTPADRVDTVSSAA